MARPLMPRTRLSTFARSIGAVTVSSAGPIDGATGSLGTLRSLDSSLVVVTLHGEALSDVRGDRRTVASSVSLRGVGSKYGTPS